MPNKSAGKRGLAVSNAVSTVCEPVSRIKRRRPQHPLRKLAPKPAADEHQQPQPLVTRMGPLYQRRWEKRLRQMKQPPVKEVETAAAAETKIDSSSSTDTDTDMAEIRLPSPLINDGDPPIPPPDSVLRLVPDPLFCGHDLCRMTEHTGPKSTKNLKCRDCRCAASSSALHILPCGHGLCWNCLTSVADGLEERQNSVWPLVRWLLRQHYSTECEYDEDLGERRKADYTDNTFPMRMARQASGQTCCGLPMYLERFAGCMEAATAARCWLAAEALKHPPPELVAYVSGGSICHRSQRRPRCAWPDCGVPLPPSCSYTRDRMETYYCVRCQGNSFHVGGGDMIAAR